MESRYTIEYIYPESFTNSTSRKGWAFIFFFCIIGLITLGLAISILYPFKSFDALTTTAVFDNLSTLEGVDSESEDEKQHLLDTALQEKEEALLKIDSLSQQNKNLQEKQQASSQQLVTNEDLTNNLDNLTSELLAEKKKNEELSTQINAHQSKNSELSNLLEDALNKADSAEKHYLSTLEELDKTEPQTDAVETNETIITDEQVTNEVAIEVAVESKNSPSNNTVRLGASLQVDAIVAAMQNINHSSGGTRVKNPAKSIQSASDSTEQLHKGLQNQVNQIIKTSRSQTSSYKKELIKESSVREHAMRSIVVKKGETLWTIARRAYGNGSLYKKIIEANPHIKKNGKVLLITGQVIRVPI